MFHLLKYIFESGILVPFMSKVWEDTNGCSKQYICDLATYLMDMLSYSYDIIMDCAMNALGYGKNVVDTINEMETRFFGGK